MAVLEFLKSALVGGARISWPSVSLVPLGFQSGDAALKWSDVSEIAAFKRDALTVDDVWFQITTPSGTALVCEEQPGFTEFEAEMVRLFPSVANWRQRVLLPPFAANFTVLYERT